MITKELLLEIGKKKGLTNKEHIEKDYFQDVILYNLFKKTNEFIFKGGTALYKLYNLPRFSEDLDFSLNSSLEVNAIENMIKDVIENDHFSIKSIKRAHNTLLIKIACKGILTKYNTVRIDINLKNKILRKFDVKNYISQYIDINPFTMRVLSIEEITAEKIHCIFTRQKSRDLFDLFLLLRISSIDKKLIDEKLRIFNIMYDHEIVEKRIGELRTLWEKELKPFILGDLPDFIIVRDFVLSKLKAL